MNGSGRITHISSSTSAANSSHVEGAAVGTAMMMRVGCRCLMAATAACIVAPVAMPSSTSMTVRPPTSYAGRSPRKRCSRRSNSCSSCAVISSITSSGIFRNCTTSLLSMRIPLVAIAPIASSSCPGTPSFRTTMTSSGACSA